MERLVEWNGKDKKSALPKCINEWGDTVWIEDICVQLATIYDILGDECDLDRLRKLAQANRIVGKEIWSEARYLHLFKTKPGDIERSTVQYVSILRDGNILCHTQTCAFSLDEIGRTVFMSREEALKAGK